MTKTYDYDHIIIGGGSGGLSLASAAGQLGVKTLLVDREMLGGDCLHYGCVPSKALIKSAKVAHQLKHLAKYGLSPLDKGGLGGISWQKITERISAIQADIQEHDSAERFRNLGCDVIFGSAHFADAHTVEIKLNPELKVKQDDTTITQLKKHDFKFSAKKITIATGSRPRIPEIEGLKESGFITNEDLFTLESQPETLAIIGGGVIASEMAQALQRLGTKVTIFEQHDQFFGRFDSDISTLMHTQFKAEDIEILTNAKPTKVDSIDTDSSTPNPTKSTFNKENLKVITFTQNQQTKTRQFDEILVAAGRIPNTNIGLENAGVEYTTRDIKVDAKLRTNQKHITAIGDVNGASMFTHTANYEAGLIVRNEILGVPFGGKTNYDQIGWTIYTDPEIASIGVDEKQAIKQGLKYEVVKFELAKNDRAKAESDTNGFVKILVDRKKRIIGAQIVAPRAGEMIREWQLAIGQKMKLSTIAQSTYIYPTFGEASKWAASTYFGPKLFNKNVKGWLRTLWGYRGK